MKRTLSFLLAAVLAAALLVTPAAAASAPWVQIEGGDTDTQTVTLRDLPGRYTGVQITLELNKAITDPTFTRTGGEAEDYSTFRLEGSRLTLYVTSKVMLNQEDILMLGTITANESFQVVSASGLRLVSVGPDDTQTVAYDNVSLSGGSSFSGSSSGTSRYAVAAAPGAGGSLQISDTHARRGDTVTVTVTEEEGYVLSALTVTDRAGREVAVTDLGEGKWSFVMPASAVTITASFAPERTELPFTDVDEDDWFWESVAYVYDAGLMSGTGETSFSPDMVTTRGMVVAILHRYEGSPAAGAADFPDVAPDQYYASAVAWAAANGVVSGYDSGLFGPNEAITREQMAAILCRYAQYKGMDVSVKADLSAFTDADQISAYAVDAMAWANQAGLIAGVDSHTLQPGGPATRAQAAAILMRFCRLVEGE